MNKTDSFQERFLLTLDSDQTSKLIRSMLKSPLGLSHKVVNASKGEGFNIWVERMHNTLRQRTKTFRGFHRSVESAYAIMKGLEIYYNFIRKHEALKGKTPSELAMPYLKFETPNRWLELIQIASHLN